MRELEEANQESQGQMEEISQMLEQTQEDMRNLEELIEQKDSAIRGLEAEVGRLKQKHREDKEKLAQGVQPEKFKKVEEARQILKLQVKQYKETVKSQAELIRHLHQVNQQLRTQRVQQAKALETASSSDLLTDSEFEVTHKKQAKPFKEYYRNLN